MTKVPRRQIESVDHYQVDGNISVRGSTEKNVLRDPANNHCYIAKLGRRNNDLEVMSEYAIYLVGRSLGVDVAEARLGRYQGQLRFMSRYFLDTSKSEELVHGMQLFRELYDERTVQGVLGDETREQAMFSVQSVRAAFGAHYLQYGAHVEAELFGGFVGMLTHDAIIGVMDRHSENWGVVVQREVHGPMPRFAPLYDSARGLFCNESDGDLARRYDGAQGLQRLDGYVDRARPLVGCEGLVPVRRRRYITHAQLLAEVFHQYPEERPRITSILDTYDWKRVQRDLARELGDLCSPRRRALILSCLRRRLRTIRRAIDARMRKAGQP